MSVSPIAPRNVRAPRTDDEVDSYVDRRISSYRNQSVVGFLILLVGLFLAIHVNDYQACQGRANTDKEITRTIGGILGRLDTANALQYEKGRITAEERQEAHSFYSGELIRLPVPENCSMF